MSSSEANTEVDLRLTDTHMHTHACTRMHTYMCTLESTHTCMHVHAHASTHTGMHAHTAFAFSFLQFRPIQGLTLYCQRTVMPKPLETFKNYLGVEGGRRPQPHGCSEDNQMEVL